MRGALDETLAAIPRRLWSAMERSRRRQFLGTLRLMAIASLAELVTIGSLIPLLAVAVTPERADRMIGIGTLERLVGPGNLLPVMIACLIAASLAGGVIRLALLKATNNLAFGFAHDVATEIFRRTLRQPYLVHASRNPSEVIAGLDKVNVLAYSALLPIMQGLVAIFLALSIVFVLALVAPLATLLAASMVAAAYLLFAPIIAANSR
jgi:ATP-binding cassette subfamily B protein